MDANSFERLWPSRFLSFSFPNPKPSSSPYADPLRIAVLDSPHIWLPPPRMAAVLVPRGRESDWIFSTEAGHLQLLLASSSPDIRISRLVLIGDLPPDGSSPAPYARSGSIADPDLLDEFQQALLPLLLALSPKAAFDKGLQHEVPFVLFEDDLVRIVPVEILVGPVAGKMLVEDVEIDDGGSPVPRLFRRLRFKKLPMLVQSKVRLLPTEPSSSSSSSGGLLRPEMGSLLLPYLAPMVAGLSLISPALQEYARVGLRPRALCLGVGGGSLLVTLESKLGFDVLGVEADQVVLEVAKRHFGLIEGEFLQVCAGDGIAFIERFVDRVGWFDAIMVDMNGDAESAISAPPMEFCELSVLLAARSSLRMHGVLVVNVLLQDRHFYSHVIDTFHEVFPEVYEVDVGNEENVVLIGTKSTVGTTATGSGSKDPWMEQLYQVIGLEFVDRIKKI